MSSSPELARRIARISFSGTMRVAAEAARLRAQGVELADFGAGEPDFPTPEHIKQAAIQAIQDNFTRYTPSGGTLELKEAVCRRHAADYGTAYRPAECAITVGGKHAVFNLVQVLIEEGDEVLIPVPFWVTYKDVVEYVGGQPVFVPTDEREGFALTAARLEAHLTARTRAIIINSPCNPSGALIPREEFARILALAARRGLYVLTDECYARLVYEGAPFSAAALEGARETVLVAGSLSKTYAMTGWRIGYALGPERVIQAVVKLQSHSTSNPSSISQKAALAALDGPQDVILYMLEAYRQRRDFVVRRLRAVPGVTCLEPQGCFYAYPNVGAALGREGLRSAMQLAERLLAGARVAVVPGEAFGTGDHIRISYAASLEELERGLGRLHEFMVRTSV